VCALELNPIGVTLWGDSKQSHPLSHDEKTHEKGYTLSLLAGVEYIAKEEKVGNIPYQLVKQYRMVPELAELPGAVFYPEMLQNGELSRETPDLSGSNLPNLESHLTFINTPEKWEIQDDNGLSFFNIKETLVAASFVDRLHQARVNAEKIAILAFYDGEITFAK
jgi:superfamily I DNA and/or RNA helicase